MVLFGGLESSGSAGAAFFGGGCAAWRTTAPSRPRKATTVTSRRDRDADPRAPHARRRPRREPPIVNNTRVQSEPPPPAGGSEADLEAIASQLNSPTDVSDDAALGFDDSGRRLDRLLDDAERRRIQKARAGRKPRAPRTGCRPTATRARCAPS